MFSTEIKRMNLENRISLLSGRNKENGRIITKLRRQLASINKEENKSAAAGSENA